MGGTNRILKILKERHISKIEIKNDHTALEKIEKLLPDKYKMKRLRSLNLSHMELTSLPKDLVSEAIDADVHSVDLSKNKISSFPETLIALHSQLEELNLSKNKLSEVSEKIRIFDRLIYINLSQNCLTSLPLEFGNLKSLRELDVSFNR